MSLEIRRFFKKTPKYDLSLHEKCVRYILRSALTLEEDMNHILLHFNPGEEYDDEIRLTRSQKVMGACSIAAVIFCISQDCSVLLTAASAYPFIAISTQHMRDQHLKKSRRHNFEILVDTFAKIGALNRKIVDHFRTRLITNPVTAAIIDPYTRGMRQLVKVVFKEEVKFLYTLVRFIHDFGIYVPLLETEYAGLENIQFSDFCSKNIETVQDGFTYLQRLTDVQVLLTSNCLTCLALLLCPRVCVKSRLNCNEVFNNVVPRIQAAALNCYNDINRKFDDVKYYHLNRSHPKDIFKKPKPGVANKLQLYGFNTLSNTSEILEISQILFKKLQEVNVENISEKETIAQCIYELRDQVYDYYQSLDVLHKIIQVDINAFQGKSPFSHLQIPRKPLENVDVDEVVPDASLNPVEPSDDEEYELQITGDEPSHEEAAHSFYEEETRKFASALSQELKQKLKTNSRFVAAREKRGIVDEEIQKSSEEVEIEEQAPRVIIPGPGEMNYNPVDEEGRPVNHRLIPPPPPPPLPPIDLGPFGGNQGSIYTVDDFLDALQNASKSRSNIEEVFSSSPERN